MDVLVTLSHPTLPVVLGVYPYEVIALGVSDDTWRRRFVEGRYQNGRSLVCGVLEAPTLTIAARVSAAAWSDTRAPMNALRGCLRQRSYTATVVIGGSTDMYSCEPGDIATRAGATLDPALVRAGVHEVVLTIPVRPS
jgi:hypothetical protein